MIPPYPVQVIEIRPGSPADAPAIAQVRRESWLAAYDGIIPAPVIDRVTAAGGTVGSPPPYRRTLVAVAGDHSTVIGYASFGPERTVASVSWSQPSPAGGRPAQAPPAARAFSPAAAAPSPAAAGAAPSPAPAAGPLTPAGQAGGVGELYALYVSPAWWSAGVGRALMSSVLAALEAERYRRVVLWVLADNARARRFYDRAGFAPDGGTNILTGLGGVLEVRYSRDF
jgi:ribosomal protein S18 acetylase RimI-like enzyme